ncbi:hypothetical protein FA95DRAFT_113703 [Auriscalpium vulgare]|uniref:Uncharacterized protein n=1 Tax=Auriscalpium vulgare TaxID=40419 RepID=A0ACB8S794_9AGAM|nr:hypothetical protein FA95DRAFT_113703 [Auriscalpium vulgare]
MPNALCGRQQPVMRNYSTLVLSSSSGTAKCLSTSSIRCFGALQHLRLQSIEFPKLRFMRNDGDNRPQPETQFNLLLRTSPWLQVLILRGSASGFKARLSNLFAHCQFKCLRELRLDISRTSANLEAYACLLEETPTLEVLEGNMGWGRALQPGSLPNLRRIAVYMGFYSTVEGVVTLFLDESLAPRRLEEFSCAVLTADVVDILRRGLHADTLRKLSVLFFESLSVLVDVVRLFPRLTWLSVPSREYMNDYHSATIKPIHLGQWGEVLVNLAELKTFYGVCLLRDPSSSWSTLNNDERAQELLEALPALRWTDHWDLKPEARRIALGRGSDGRATWKVEELLNYDGLDLRWAGDW